MLPVLKEPEIAEKHKRGVDKRTQPLTVRRCATIGPHEDCRHVVLKEKTINLTAQMLGLRKGPHTVALLAHFRVSSVAATPVHTHILMHAIE